MDKKKILIVEDEPTALETLKDRLEYEGYDVVGAEDGEIGLAKAREENPDLMILDLMLPKINGYKICRMLKFDDQYKHIPIIMVTARAQAEDEETGIETGADAYIRKPYDAEDLLSKIEELLSLGKDT